jgi:hypothetical protein
MLCGEEIAKAEKNLEHPLPRWLLEWSGAVDYPFMSHIDYTADPPKPVMIAADRFKFPAHRTCNTQFGEGVESLAMKAVKMLSETGITTALDLAVIMS